MGWRAQDAYDREERERVRALPLRERYAWGRLALIGAGAVIVAAVRWWIG